MALTLSVTGRRHFADCVIPSWSARDLACAPLPDPVSDRWIERIFCLLLLKKLTYKLWALDPIQVRASRIEGDAVVSEKLYPLILRPDVASLYMLCGIFYGSEELFNVISAVDCVIVPFAENIISAISIAGVLLPPVAHWLVTPWDCGRSWTAMTIDFPMARLPVCSL
ncbi:hypothetical protein EVAR_41194_1 [Eumeta japonica]|uniref:Uncharacterized protein n=1 Tax=Eumeta variegata TaxID=151549 RepID=A0A4C1WTA2_EUMVA|nr:hypothetical protein EVAR_41194_1 [Eumeta japonica]